MAEASRRASEVAGPTWIIAKEQTAARGRRGRAWVTPAKNFAGTLVMRPKEDAQVTALRSFVAALAVFDACVDLTGRTVGFSLKWPNDVLLNGGKLAGILLESVGRDGMVEHLSIGIGVNLEDAPNVAEVEERAFRPTALSSAGTFVSQDDFAISLASNYAAWETKFTRFGFGPVREEWLARAARIGEVITAKTMQSTHEGTFETVDEQGNLVLKTANGRQAIPAADVYF